MEFFTKEYASIFYEKQKELIKIVWKRQPEEEEYHDVFESAISYVRGGNTFSRFLSDTRRQGVMSPQYRKWFETEILPQAIEIGMKRAAVITDSNPFRRYYLNLLLSAVNKFNIPFKILGDEEKAVDFLMR